MGFLPWACIWKTEPPGRNWPAGAPCTISYWTSILVYNERNRTNYFLLFADGAVARTAVRVGPVWNVVQLGFLNLGHAAYH